MKVTRLSLLLVATTLSGQAVARDCCSLRGYFKSEGPSWLGAAFSGMALINGGILGFLSYDAFALYSYTETNWKKWSKGISSWEEGRYNTGAPMEPSALYAPLPTRAKACAQASHSALRPCPRWWSAFSDHAATLEPLRSSPSDARAPLTLEPLPLSSAQPKEREIQIPPYDFLRSDNYKYITLQSTFVHNNWEVLLSGVLQGLLAIELFRISWMLTFGWRRFFLNGGKVRAESKSCVRRRLLDPCLKATIKAFFSISDELVCATFTLTLNLTLSLTLMLAFFSISGEFVRYHRRRVLTVYNSLYISHLDASLLLDLRRVRALSPPPCPDSIQLFVY